MNENTVIFKGTNNGITIMLDENATFETLKDALTEKAKSAKDFFKNAKTAIKFSGVDLTDEQEKELLEIINSNTDIDISFVASGDSDLPVLTKPKFKQKPEETEVEDKKEGKLDQLISEALVTAKKNLTTFHKGSVRSGQSIRFPGSIVVIGDVNPGGELIADGNIIVLGILKGLAHAGCSGSHDCFVAALNMRPTQLRIAELITCFPEDELKVTPQYAYINENQIYVEPLL
jgi:septum site-determining protein MinC